MFYRMDPEKGISDYFFARVMSQASPAHVHSHMEFIFVLQGNVTVIISDKKYVLSVGDMAIVMPYEIHHYVYAQDASAFVFACPPEYLPEYKKLIGGKVFSPPTATYNEIQRLLIEQIVSEDYRDDLKKKALLYSAISGFLDASSMVEVPVLEYDVYRKALIYISEHYKEAINMKTTAMHVGITVEHLSRVLNNKAKRGFSDILNSMRAYEARNLLLETAMSISEVAMEVGFGSMRNFNRVFLKYYDCQPREFRKANK